MGANRRRELVLRVLRNAVLDRQNIGVAGGLVVGAMVLGAAPLLFLAVGGFVSAVAADACRGRNWQRASTELRARPLVLPLAVDYESPTARELLGRLERARAQRTSRLRGRRGGEPRVGAMAERAGAVEALVLRELAALDRIAGAIANQAPAFLHNEHIRLQKLVADAPAAETRRQYERALVLLEQRLSGIEQIEERRAFFHARLESMIGLLEILPVELLKLEVLESSAFAEDDAAIGCLVDELEAVELAARSISAGMASDEERRVGQ